MPRGIDCVTRLTPKAAAKAKTLGFDFVGRYLVPPGMYKELTRQEAEDICAAGLNILCVWETTASRAREGAGAGGVDGAKALQCARAIEMPENGIIYFAVDYDAQPEDFPRIAEYLKAARAQTGPYSVGVYGSYRVIEAMHIRGLCKGYWQCVAWSYGHLSPHRTVYQREWSGGPEALKAKELLGFSVDINDCDDLDRAGIWNYQEERMTGKDILNKLSDAEAYELLEKAQRHAATLPIAADPKSKADYQAAVKAGITDGTAPMGIMSRWQGALMALRGKK